MALSVAVRTFDWLTTDALNATIDVNFGFTPKAIMLVSCTSQTATGVSTTVARGAARIGFAGGTLSANRTCLAYETFDGAAAADVRSWQSNAAICHLSGSTGRLDIDAEANWPANSIRFIVEQAMSLGINAHITVLALGGTDIVASTTGTITEPAGTGDQTITTTGVNPTLVILATAGPTDVDAVHGDGCFMLGAGDGTRSWVQAMGSDDAAATMDTVGYMKSGQIVALMPVATAVTIDAEATLVSLGTAQFVLNWSTRTAAARHIKYLAIELATSLVRVDSLTTATDLNNFSVTGYGMTPAGLILVSAGRAESTATTPTANSMLSVGMIESTTVREAQAMRDDDAVANADVTVALDTAEGYINLTPSGTVDATMDLVSFDSDGMTLVMDNAEASASFVGVIAFGAAAAGGGAASLSTGGILTMVGVQ